MANDGSVTAPVDGDRSIVVVMREEAAYWLAQARDSFEQGEFELGSIYRNEKDQISSQLWGILARAVGSIDDAGCDWFTIGNDTFIAFVGWHVSSEPEVAQVVNAINALAGCPGLIYHSREEAVQDGRTDHLSE